MTPEETAALQERANREHHELLVRLHAQLESRGWNGIAEVPGAINLEASRDGTKAIFEAKTIS